MSLISVILLLAAGAALAMLVAALRAARGLQKEVATLRNELADFAAAGQPATSPDEELIRAAVADALTDERERELAEARAFWAEQEAREAARPEVSHRPFPGADEAILDALLERYLSGEDLGIEPEDLEAATGAPNGDEATDCPDHDPHGHQAPPDSRIFVPRQTGEPRTVDEFRDDDGIWSAEVAAARRRHPSHPDHSLTGEPLDQRGSHSAAAEEHRRTTELLGSLAESAVPLVDVRPGPLGTLDVLLFDDGTTLCFSPGHRETAEQLAAAVRSGTAAVLLGGSAVSDTAYALTFGYGDESVYLLADRIVTA